MMSEHRTAAKSSESQNNSTSAAWSPWIIACLVGFVGFTLVASTAWRSIPSLPLETTVAAAEPQQDSDSTGSSKKKPSPATNAEDNETKDLEEPSDKKIENPFPRRFKLEGTELSGGTEWLNTSGAIELADLRGKVVLLDFWTYCCINCMHILPDLKFLEQKYSKELVVIGVHSAKFDNEKETENIRRAILRYEIEHPVVNDSEMKVWRGFGVRAWPTLVLVDPEGYYCGYVSGEGNREALDGVIAKVIAYHKSKGTLDRTPVRFDLERHRAQPGALRFPGKVLADEASNRLFITDSNHNRIVITTLDGKLLDVVGGGESGRTDGDYQKARFFRPQGTALVGERLYVADTENHLLRVVDLKAKKVTTIAGTGEQAHFRAQGGPMRQTALNSPWAITHVDGTLYVAMAGPHQLWAHKLGSETIKVFAGSGREDILNGPLNEAAFAQPSGISSDGKSLFVADSEGSAIRKVGLGSKGEVTTVAGTSNLPQGQSLFAFGDVDEVGGAARFQHPLDVLYHNGSLLVADSYNHKVRKIDLATRAVTTLLGKGKPGTDLSPALLSEPAGLSIANDKLFIADTNNHRILVASLTSDAVTELKIDGLQPPPPPAEETQAATETKDTINVASQTVAAGDELKFEIGFQLPEGFKLNRMSKVTYKLEAAGEQSLIAAEHLKTRKTADAKESSAIATVPLAQKDGEAKLILSVTFGYCRDGVSGVCKIKTARWNVPIKVSADGKSNVVKLQAVAD